MDSCILIDDLSDNLPIILCLDLHFTTPIAPKATNKRIFNEMNKNVF